MVHELIASAATTHTGIDITYVIYVTVWSFILLRKIRSICTMPSAMDFTSYKFNCLYIGMYFFLVHVHHEVNGKPGWQTLAEGRCTPNFDLGNQV